MNLGPGKVSDVYSYHQANLDYTIEYNILGYISLHSDVLSKNSFGKK